MIVVEICSCSLRRKDLTRMYANETNVANKIQIKLALFAYLHYSRCEI